MALRLALFSALLPGALAYVRTAAAVDGVVVAGAGNLTMGGKVGTYTVLLQVLNPGVGNLELLLECCGDARPLASEVAMKINTNAFAGADVPGKIKQDYTGQGKCRAPGAIEGFMKQGDAKCTYTYVFENKDWKKYEYMSYCVPEDVCGVDVVGATKGTKIGYNLVIQILNPNAGDLVYAGEGPIGNCLDGSLMVNTANISGFRKAETQYVNVFGSQIPVGTKDTYEIPGMQQLGLLPMLGQCNSKKSDAGMLYVYRNKYWNKAESFMNISEFLAAKKAKEDAQDLAELMAYKVPEQPAPAAPAPVAPPALKTEIPDVKGLAEILKPKLKAEEKDGLDEVADPEATQAIVDKAEAKEKEIAEEKEEKAEELAEEAPKTAVDVSVAAIKKGEENLKKAGGAVAMIGTGGIVPGVKAEPKEPLATVAPVATVPPATIAPALLVTAAPGAKDEDAKTAVEVTMAAVQKGVEKAKEAGGPVAMVGTGGIVPGVKAEPEEPVATVAPVATLPPLATPAPVATVAPATIAPLATAAPEAKEEEDEKPKTAVDVTMAAIEKAKEAIAEPEEKEEKEPVATVAPVATAAPKAKEEAEEAPEVAADVTEEKDEPASKEEPDSEEPKTEEVTERRLQEIII